MYFLKVRKKQFFDFILCLRSFHFLLRTFRRSIFTFPFFQLAYEVVHLLIFIPILITLKAQTLLLMIKYYAHVFFKLISIFYHILITILTS